MKKTGKRIIAIALAVVMTLSLYTVGAVAIVSLLSSNTFTKTADGSTIINANSVDEAIELMESTPEFFSGEQITDKADPMYGKDSVIYPTVIIPGISQSISYVADEQGYPAYSADGAELSGGLLILDTSNLVPTLANNLLAPLTRALITQSDSDKTFQKAVTKTVKEIFSIQASDTNGEPINNLKTVSYKTSVAGMSQDDRDYFYRMIPMKRLTEDTIDATTGEVVTEACIDDSLLYLYAFPLIGDPMESAKGLDEYIQFVKKDSGLDKVNLVTISLGGTIMTAYMELMKGTGYTDINRIINVVSCLQGTDVMGDFYMRNFRIKGEDDVFFFQEFLPMVMNEVNGDASLGYIINVALKIMPKEVVYSLLTGAVDGIIDSLMLNCPQFWAMIPTDRFDDVKAKYNFIWDTTNPDYSNQVLANKIDAFHTAAVNLEDNLKEFAAKDDRLVHFVAGYGLDYSAQDYCFFAAMKSSETTNSDAIIDIDSTTLGDSSMYATAGQVLDDDTLFSADARISPDGSLDISKCAFPDNTWFFYGQHHEVGRNDVIISLIGNLVTGEIKSVADKSDKYPQFNGNRNTRNITRWRLDDAAALIMNYENGKTVDIEGNEIVCREADIIELTAAYKECLALLDDTLCEPTSAAAATERIEDAIYRVGHNGELPEEEGSNEILGAVAQFLDSAITAIFGAGNGFSEFEKTGVLAGK
ncbi:MAG: hypothetical protein IKV44_07230 [Clostridia bacterium]|nr:hypothetical protein [Clostridia bacterium]